MYDIFTQDTSIQSYLINGHTVKNLRQTYSIGFNDFCFRASLSTRTLASIEKKHSVIVRPETVRRILIGFNLTRRGTRKRPVLRTKFVRGAYTKPHPELLLTQFPSRKMTVYLNREVRAGIATYAKSHGVTENQALLSIARKHLGVFENEVKYSGKI